MNDKQKLILQKNLTRSAKKAKKHWVRGLIGHTETEQAFFDVMSIPVNHPLTSQPAMLDELLS